jgi:hypothetical protein
MNSDVRRRLKALADDLEGPLGRIPFDRALREHIGVFEKLRREGCTWSQLARALAAVGVRRADGEIISADHLRGAVSRQIRARSHAPSDSVARTARTEPASPPSRGSKGGAQSTIATGKPASAPAPALLPPDFPKSGKPERMPNASRSVREKLARVAKLRGG